MRDLVGSQFRPLRFPLYMLVKMGKWRRASEALAEHLGRTPTPEEVGSTLGLSTKQKDAVVQAMHVRSLRPFDPGSTESDLDNHSCGETYDSASDPLIRSEELGQLQSHLSRLSDREARVIRMRFGLDLFRQMSLREIGESMGLSCERVRLIEKGAMRQLARLLRSDHIGHPEQSSVRTDHVRAMAS